ncbi:putative nuclease HARBI1 [Telopea speciosissima]|uniref:putative nuclease HARBI1 n=1 Tax=Telopea speciosissima TaxID=54955 RepID=UPI001CC4A79E|nr:putative nuclease HARBI1 [Telopea speciosissima]
MIVGRGFSNRDIQEEFQHSGETISRTFKRVVMAMGKLAKEMITPPDIQKIQLDMQSKPKYYPFFKDCIGAIDGSHISAIVPQQDATRYRNRKGITTQNVMCICSFDMRFTYVYAGWEGSANDCRIFERARRDPTLQFPHPPEGKYYVVDSGYASQVGYLTPFRGERYHIPDYKGAGRNPKIAKELVQLRTFLTSECN